MKIQARAEELHRMIDEAEMYYLDFVNDFLTIERFAEYHGISECFAGELIKVGRAKNRLRSVDVIEREL
jgi:hypothetical protein